MCGLEQNVRMDLFAKNLRERAAALGRSNAEIARALDINERRYAHYVSGAREPDLMLLIRIAKALGTTPDKLLGLDELDEGSEDILVERLMLAARQLEPSDIESIVVQTEALAALRRFQATVSDVATAPTAAKAGRKRVAKDQS